MPFEDFEDFEDEFGDVLRRVGSTFDTDLQEKLIVTAAEQGRRTVRRRRGALAAAATVVVLGALGTGAYANGVLPDIDRDRDSSVADENPVVGGDRVFTVFERLLPEGRITERKVLPRKPGEYAHVSFVYEDAKGTGLVDFRLGLADPRRGDDGGRPLEKASHEQPYTTPETKSVRRQHVTPDGHYVDMTVWNAPDPRHPRGTGPVPVLMYEMRRLTHANEWRAEFARLPKPDPLLGEEPLDPAWVRPPATVPGPGMADTLTSLLPKGTVTAQKGRGTDDPLGPAASLQYDDGKGRAGVTVQLFRVDPDGYSTRQFMTCRSRDCTRAKLPDGSRVKTSELKTGKAPRVKWRQATHVSASGDMVEVTTWNAPASDAAPVRAEPPLTQEQLKDIAMSPRWKTALGALPQAPDEESGGATRPWDAWRIESMFAYRPKAVWDEDGRGPGLLEVRTDASRRNTGDEPVLEVRQEKVEEGGKGVIRWVVTGAGPGRTFTTITAYNAPAPDADATRRTPPVPLPHLKAAVLGNHDLSARTMDRADARR